MKLTEKLAALRLSYLSNNLPSFLSGLEGKDALDVVTRMADLEMVEKASRTTDRRLKAAKIGNFRPMSDFDWEWTKGLSRNGFETLAESDFTEKYRNIILAGAQGIGKTMIAQNLAFSAAMKGHSTLFTTASKLILDLSAQETNSALQRRLGKYERIKLLVIDELGYLNFTDRAADFIFEIVNRRYQKGSIIITTNLAFKDWHQVFPGAPCVTAMIDRLTHHADIIKLSGDSYRTREASENKQKKGSKRNG